MGNAEQLRELWLANNTLHGSLPHDLLANAPELTRVDLGLFIVIIISLLLSSSARHQLIIVWIGNNAGLTGELPDTFSSNTALRIFRAPMCALHGTLPPSLLALETLETLDVSFNRLSGTLPDVLQSASAMQALVLSNNLFTGAAPRSLGLLRDGVCRTLDLSFNDLRGPIPNGLRRVTSLTALDLSFNRFDAVSERTIAALSSLTACDLRGNAFACPLIVRRCCFAKKKIHVCSLNFDCLSSWKAVWPIV